MVDRILAYSDRFTQYLVGTISSTTVGDSVNNEVDFGESGKVWLALEVSGEEYTKLFSAAMTGADLVFTDEAQEIVWTLWKAAKMGTFCEAVAQCILSSPETQAALLETLADNGYTGGVGNPGQPVSQTVLDQDWLDGITCDNDALWGSCQHVVDGVFDATTEVLQRLELAANTIDQIAEVLDAIPIIGGILSLGLTVLNWSLQTAYDVWVVVDSQAVRDEIACNLFCRGQETCTLTMQMVVDTFVEVGGSAPPIESDYKSQIEWLIGLDVVSSPAVVAAANIAMLGVFTLKYGGKFGQTLLGIHSLQQLTAIGAVDFPNSGWSVLCECGWSVTWIDPELGTDWIASAIGQSPVMGVYAESVEWSPQVGWNVQLGIESPGAYRTALEVKITIPADIQLTSVDVVYNLDNSGVWSGTSPRQFIYLSSPATDMDLVWASTDPSGEDKELSWSGNITTVIEDTLRIQVNSGREFTGVPVKRGDGLVKSITIAGVGTNPFL